MIKISKSQKEALSVIEKMLIASGKPNDWGEDIMKLIYGILDIEDDCASVTVDIVGDGVMPVQEHGPIEIKPMQEQPLLPGIYPHIQIPNGTLEQIRPTKPYYDKDKNMLRDPVPGVYVGDTIPNSITTGAEEIRVYGTITSSDFIPDGGSISYTINQH